MQTDSLESLRRVVAKVRHRTERLKSETQKYQMKLTKWNVKKEKNILQAKAIYGKEENTSFLKRSDTIQKLTRSVEVLLNFFFLHSTRCCCLSVCGWCIENCIENWLSFFIYLFFFCFFFVWKSCWRKNWRKKRKNKTSCSHLEETSLWIQFVQFKQIVKC